MCCGVGRRRIEEDKTKKVYSECEDCGGRVRGSKFFDSKTQKRFIRYRCLEKGCKWEADE